MTSSVLAPGEVAVALCLSRDQRISKVILNFIDGIIQNSPLLRSLIVNRTADTIELKDHVQITVRPCASINVRGLTLICCVADEIAHWFTSTDYADPDVEIVAALRPALMTTKGPLLMASSAYSRSGVLFETYKQDYGATGATDILVGYGTSRDMNPSLPQADIDREITRDPIRNRAEYLSEWRDDVSGFIAREIVEACVGDYYELPRVAGISYSCFLDAATGIEGGDSYTLAISHRDGNMVIIDAVRECKPPFSPAAVIQDVAIPFCKTYGVTMVTGDNYAGQFAQEPFRNAGLTYELASKHKSALYADPFLSLLSSRRITLPRHDRAISQICALERSVKRAGRDVIDHPVHGRDDLANSIAGAASLVYEGFGYDSSQSASQPDFIDLDAPDRDKLLKNRPYGTTDAQRGMLAAYMMSGCRWR